MFSWWPFAWASTVRRMERDIVTLESSRSHWHRLHANQQDVEINTLKERIVYLDAWLDERELALISARARPMTAMAEAMDAAHKAVEPTPIVHDLMPDRIRRNVASHVRAQPKWTERGSQKELAEALGVSPSTAHNLGSGKVHTSTITLYRLACHLGIPLEVLMTQEAGE